MTEAKKETLAGLPDGARVIKRTTVDVNGKVNIGRTTAKELNLNGVELLVSIKDNVLVISRNVTAPVAA